MRARKGICLSLGITLSCGILWAAPAAAELEPIQLVSKSATEQADSAVAPAISANGRYVVFQGSIGGLAGVFRKDLESGVVEPVVSGDAYASPAPGADAAAPSISANGRYISFTTTTALDPANDQQASSSDVYVRDMAVPAAPDEVCGASSPCAYELASALDGCDPAVSSSCGLTYEGAGGSVASARVALSADGRRVVFVTNAASNLTSVPGGSTPGTPTPAGQVLLRDLDSDRTALVSAVRDPATGQMTDPPQPVLGGAVTASGQPGFIGRQLGASLSADGTTVAWLGAHLPAQVPLLADEEQAIALADFFSGYDEPLWRRVADGPLAQTRRITGGGDPLAPGCPADGTLEDPACQGPFPELTRSLQAATCAGVGWTRGNRDVDVTPQLSADGRTVALIGDPNDFANVFLVDMHGGLTRREALSQLTREVPLLDPCVAGTPESVGSAGPIFDLAISPGGRRIAFATARQQFPLAPPNLVGAPPAGIGLAELYRIDLDRETLERVTGGPAGEPSLSTDGLPGERGASSPSFSADGRTLAFASLASNLIGGDANGASDAFVVSDRGVAEAPGAVSISAPPPRPRPRRHWKLWVSASSRPDGSVRLFAAVPGAGILRVGAREAEAEARRLARPLLALRRRARREGVLALTLRAKPGYRHLVRSAAGLAATVKVAFTSRHHRPLYDELEVHFRRGGGNGRKSGEGGR